MRDLSYYPLFFDLEKKTVLLIGGGHVALEKAGRLNKNGCRLRVIAPQILDGFSALEQAELIQRTWKPEDLDDAFLVIAATDDAEQNHQIAKIAQEKRVLCNVVDDAAYSQAIFGSVIERGPLTIGISTGGTSPSAAVYLKEKIAQTIPERFDEILEYLGSLRPFILETFPKSVRPKLFRALFEACMEQGRPLGEDELKEILAIYGR